MATFRGRYVSSQESFRNGKFQARTDWVREKLHTLKLDTLTNPKPQMRTAIFLRFPHSLLQSGDMTYEF